MKRLLIVYDVQGWAWHHMADAIAANAPPEVEVVTMDQGEFGHHTSNDSWLNSFDGICQCSWAEASTGIDFYGKKSTWLASHGFELPYPSRDTSNIPSRITTRIRNKRNAMRLVLCFDKILCVSNEIYRIARGMFPNAVRVRPGVDTNRFSPSDLPNKKRLTVGWCGQSKGVTKGYEEVLVPLVKSVKNVDWLINNKSAGDSLSHDEMADWYRKADIFISTSCSEGFQMPLVEAGACGRPIIATHAGAAEDVTGPGRGFLIQPYSTIYEAKESVEKTKVAIQFYDKNRDAMIEHGRKMGEFVLSSFDWKSRAAEWLEAML